MANLNRQQRRAMQRGKVPQDYETVQEPAYLTKWRTFDGMDRILTSIENGDILSENGVPVFMGVTGEQCEVVPSIEGWILMWKHATAKLNLPFDTYTPFELIKRALAADQMLRVDVVALARDAFKAQRNFYDQYPYETWHSLARDVRIQIHLQPEIGQHQEAAYA